MPWRTDRVFEELRSARLRGYLITWLIQVAPRFILPRLKANGSSMPADIGIGGMLIHSRPDLRGLPTIV